jgi:hypothetical protein
MAIRVELASNRFQPFVSLGNLSPKQPNSRELKLSLKLDLK